MKLFMSKTKNRWALALWLASIAVVIVIILNYMLLKSSKEVIILNEISTENEDSIGIPDEIFEFQEKAEEEKLIEEKTEEIESFSEKIEESILVSDSLQADDTPASKQVFSIQIGSFQDKSKAKSLKEKLDKNGYKAEVVSRDLGGKGLWYRVWVGKFTTKAQAGKTLDLIAKDYSKSFIIKR